METYLLEILRERQTKCLRDDSFRIYACFFRLGREEKIDTRLSLGKIHHNMHTVGYRSRHMQKSMRCKRSKVNF